jgi:hypothetical protein
MKIYDEHGAQVGELERPEPVEQDGVWYEAVAYRKPLPGENVYDLEEVHLLKSCSDRCREWVMRLIPTPTAEQLKAIGMKKRDDRPVEVKLNDMVWNGDGSYGNAMLGSCRWVLVPAEKVKIPVTINPTEDKFYDKAEKEPAHRSCVGCEKQQPLGTPLTCWYSCVTEPGIRRNWIPAKAPAPNLLEEYFREAIRKNIIDFAVRAQRTEDDRIVFYIHPLDCSGETADFEVHGNVLEHNRDIKETK